MDKRQIDKIKQQFAENPVEFITASAFVATAVSGLGKMIIAGKNSRTWSKEVKRRTKMTK